MSDYDMIIHDAQLNELTKHACPSGQISALFSSELDMIERDGAPTLERYKIATTQQGNNEAKMSLVEKFVRVVRCEM